MILSVGDKRKDEAAKFPGSGLVKIVEYDSFAN